ncbi:MAG TPA: hypothetical protein DIT38_02020 [Burkholderiales bacterium]|nr:hypothetical protein [Burkholderiales bacterium]
MNPFLNDPVVVLSAVRTPIGNFMGELAGLSAPELGAACIRELGESRQRQLVLRLPNLAWPRLM